MIEKKTRRLVIRPLNNSDYSIWKESELTKNLKQNLWDTNIKEKPQLTISEFNKIIRIQKKQRQNDEYHDFGVFTKKAGDLIGRVSAMNVIRSVTQSAFLGYYINNNCWGKGFGSEAVLGFVDIAFKHLGLHRLEAGIEPANKRSVRLIKSVGFRKEGLKKRTVFLREEWIDLAIYSATCEDFGIKWRGSVLLRKK